MTTLIAIVIAAGALALTARLAVASAKQFDALPEAERRRILAKARNAYL